MIDSGRWFGGASAWFHWAPNGAGVWVLPASASGATIRLDLGGRGGSNWPCSRPPSKRAGWPRCWPSKQVLCWEGGGKQAHATAGNHHGSSRVREPSIWPPAAGRLFFQPSAALGGQLSRGDGGGGGGGGEPWRLSAGRLPGWHKTAPQLEGGKLSAWASGKFEPAPSVRAPTDGGGGCGGGGAYWALATRASHWLRRWAPMVGANLRKLIRLTGAHNFLWAK